jgi:hypothetical protein
MPWQVWVAILLLIVTVVAGLGVLGAKSPTAKSRSLRIAVVAGVMTLFVVILGSTTIVSTRNIGVVTTFGRPGGTLSNGLHWKAPWQSVTEMNGTIQIDNHTGDRRLRRFERGLGSGFLNCLRAIRPWFVSRSDSFLCARLRADQVSGFLADCRNPSNLSPMHTRLAS